MERIFWVECPECDCKFYCYHKEMRHAGVKLFCPSCHARFLPEEAKSLYERSDPSTS
jgi:ssDNA-binding Zn-finger/Zn-ribbon topoisomerase 1